MDTYAVGDGVSAKDGPMKGLHGTVVWSYEDKGQLLVRFGGTQQMYFAPDELERWGA